MTQMFIMCSCSSGSAPDVLQVLSRGDVIGDTSLIAKMTNHACCLLAAWPMQADIVLGCPCTASAATAISMLAHTQLISFSCMCEDGGCTNAKLDSSRSHQLVSKTCIGMSY